jgi:squalene-hopene/tetraprenyl-beta-curcumene cyclase
MFSQNECIKLNAVSEKVKKELMNSFQPSGYFEGRLSDSAVSTAVGAMAMSINPKDESRMHQAVNWLCNNINSDKGWGDTPESSSNLSAVLLSRAALFNSGIKSAKVQRCLDNSTGWLNKMLGTTEESFLIDAILKFYGSDLTFSVPILTVCMLCNLFGNDQTLWEKIPALPFEISLIPSEFLNFFRLPVVSYAMPALIAVGTAQNIASSPQNRFFKWLRKKSLKPALRKLCYLVPESGGFLEAAPLTGFVTFCLAKSGFSEHYVVKKGLNFLRNTMRGNGSWPIDTDLATWLTSLSTKALSKDKSLDNQQKTLISGYLKKNQTKNNNDFTNAEPGGWGWSWRTGSVPDADDTSAALVALAEIEEGNADETVRKGLKWLLNLMNSDGGIPTFCRGWGYLPFDRSCPDISAHALIAFNKWKNRSGIYLKTEINSAEKKLINYLRSVQNPDGSFTPLWFGDQDSKNKTNSVYGTSVVIEALVEAEIESKEQLLRPAIKWLYNCQNPDGGYGGEANCPSKFETTAKAVTALALVGERSEALKKSIFYLIRAINKKLPASNPIGLYFSSLWYDEKLYPLIFAVNALTSVKKKIIEGRLANV